ncbi:MAG: diacylglycerol/lipid kinase family protein [Geminicoccaceae bacterium]
MARLAVISNPRSQRNRQGALAALKAVLAEHPDVPHGEILDFAELGSMVERLVRSGIEVIAVNGGDGTVQAVLTALGRRPAAEPLPKLAVLSGGMTNVIAKDVGLEGQPAKALSRLIASMAAPGRAREVTRPLIGLALHPEQPPVYGMFFGAAGFHQAVKLANDKVRTRGVAGSLASASTLTLSLFRLLFGRSGADGRSGSDDPLYRGEPMAIGVDGEQRPETPYLLLIATTLDRLILGLRPFWGDDGCAIRNGRTIRYTSIDFPPKRLARALLPVLRGRPAHWMEGEGYRSGSASTMTIDIKSPVVLDGEIFHPDPAAPVCLTGDRSQTFITGGRIA